MDGAFNVAVAVEEHFSSLLAASFDEFRIYGAALTADLSHLSGQNPIFFPDRKPAGRSRRLPELLLVAAHDSVMLVFNRVNSESRRRAGRDRCKMR
ncbi:MAG TPA: hypothetical protein VIK01_28780 [Polyangiaceae bacterium]